MLSCWHDDVIKWKHLPRYWPIVRRIHRSTVNSPHIGLWSAAMRFSLICTRIKSWVNTVDAGDFRRHRPHYDVTVMCWVAECLDWCKNMVIGSVLSLLPKIVLPSLMTDDCMAKTEAIFCRILIKMRCCRQPAGSLAQGVCNTEIKTGGLKRF